MKKYIKSDTYIEFPPEIEDKILRRFETIGIEVVDTWVSYYSQDGYTIEQFVVECGNSNAIQLGDVQEFRRKLVSMGVESDKEHNDNGFYGYTYTFTFVKYID